MPMPKPKADETWLLKKEAAERLGVSERTLERLIADGKITQSHRRVPGRRPLAVVNPADIERLEAETVKPIVVNDSSGSGSKALATRANVLPMLAGLVAAMGQQQPNKLFLNLEEASALSGLSQAFLRRLIRDGKLAAVRDVSLKVSRANLERFADNLATGAE